MTENSNPQTRPVYTTEFVLVVLWHWAVVAAAIASAGWLYDEEWRDFWTQLLMASLLSLIHI